MHTIRLIELSAAVAVTRGPQRCGVDRKPLRLERATFSLELRHGRPRDRRDTVRAFEFMNRNRAMFPIATMARVLAVSKTGYHASRRRRPPAHALSDAAGGMTTASVDARRVLAHPCPNKLRDERSNLADSAKVLSRHKRSMENRR